MSNEYCFEVFARKTVCASIGIEAKNFKKACKLFSKMDPSDFDWYFVGNGLYGTEVGDVYVTSGDGNDHGRKDMSWRGREEDYAGDFYVEDLTPEQLSLFD